MSLENNLLEIYTKYREERLAHAYLIETNNIPRLMTDLKLLIKALLCPEEYTDTCHNCSLCNLINKNNLPSIIVIEPDGAFIKKAQIEDLKHAFGTKPIYSKYNIYIMKNAEKLNSSSANAMLKFLEEPTEGIIGFFLTTNKDVIIPTIKSRCQSLVINYKEDNIKEELNLTAEDYNCYQDIIKVLFKSIQEDSLLNNKEMILSKLPERKDIETLFRLILAIYFQAFLRNSKQVYDEELLEIIEIKENNEKVTQKLNIITKFLLDLRYNVNIELLLDKFVIEMRK